MSRMMITAIGAWILFAIYSMYLGAVAVWQHLKMLWGMVA